MITTKHYKIKEISEVVNGSTPSTKEEDNYDGDIIWLTPKDLSDQRTKYIYRGERNITKKGYDSCGTKMIPPDNIIMSSRAPIGLLSINKNECCTNQGFKSLILNKKLADTNYMYYFIKHHMPQIEALGSGTTFKEVSKDSMENYEIDIPDLPTQKKIADVLSCIDDKIALNNKTNTELENMAKTIYDYWFTQFDFPNKSGHPYKTSGGQMVYNEILKREIPAGWEVKNILDCCKVIDCLHSKKPDYCYEDENCYLLQLENLIDLKLIDLTNKYYVSKKDYETWTSKTKVKQGDLVVTNAGRVGGVSRIPNYIETGIGRNMTSIRPISISEYLLCYFFSSSDCDKQIRQNTDQGAFFQSLNVKGIKKLNLTIPPKEIQEKFDSLVGKIRLQIESNHKENEELTKLRDYLLPLLMNGQIKVK